MASCVSVILKRQAGREVCRSPPACSPQNAVSASYPFAPISETGSISIPPLSLHRRAKRPEGSEFVLFAMELDQWISKVKEGQHLEEHELQLLCEYVR
ncbi:hypothetical protein ZIOFF_048540 [Zingiber officinale]|uniref:Uncharacterized protein n=1 Tax=Zingiber officinale TaxID=94328 RepID=A0A8J5KWR9_ZINOF|nr:hypothetical protein ZIOFF_048540 [Zingiber officinale]